MRWVETKISLAIIKRKFKGRRITAKGLMSMELGVRGHR